MQINTGIIRRCEQSFFRDHLANYHLKPVEALALKTIRSEGTCNQEMLCGLLDIDKGRMTRILEYLEERGLIRRVVNPGNKREKLAEATDEGLDMCLIISVLFDEWGKRCFIGFTEEEKKQYKGFLARIAHNALTEKENI